MFQIRRLPPGGFLHLACARRVPQRVARLLESAAEETCPQQASRILESRELFERAAMLAATGKGGNLELSFRVVDLLATTVETLGLARSSDVPDPFRRVWVRSESGTRRPGVVLACGDGEIAVFCPPGRGSVPEVGAVLRLSYRGFSSSVEYDLRLDDPVRLPGGLILNLVRLEGRGSIGRAHERFPVYFQAQVGRHPPGEAAGDDLVPCEILDFSSSGLRMECAPSFEPGQIVWIDVPFTDGDGPFTAQAVVRWARAGEKGQRSHGLLFDDLSKVDRERLDRFLETLRS